MGWSTGYVSDINYSRQYCLDLNPVHQALALLNVGYALPKIETACELGFGYGVSVNAHAAAQPDIKWYGTDFLPQQAQAAQRLANIVGSGAVLSDQSFAEFCSRTDLPDFDYICLHGIWSWVADEDRAVIVDFLRRKLKVGGVCYISYNVMPGWAIAAPMRELFVLHANHYQAPAQSSLAKVEGALSFVESLFAAKPGYTHGREELDHRFQNLSKMERHYLAHEYFNRNWKPMYFHEIAEMLNDAKLTFATTATYADLIDDLWMTPEQLALLREAPNPVLAQQIRDYIVNQQFRRDLWIKGGEVLPQKKVHEALREQRVTLTTSAEKIDFKINMGGRTVVLQEQVYRPVVDVLADRRIRTLGEIIDLVAPKGLKAIEAMQAVVMMIGLGMVAVCQSEAGVKAAQKTVARFNRETLGGTNYSFERGYLVSAISGNTLNLDHTSLRLLALIEAGITDENQLVDQVEAELKSGNRLMVKSDNQVVANDQENRAEIIRAVKMVFEEVIPHCKAMGIPLGKA